MATAPSEQSLPICEYVRPRIMGRLPDYPVCGAVGLRLEVNGTVYTRRKDCPIKGKTDNHCRVSLPPPDPHERRELGKVG